VSRDFCNGLLGAPIAFISVLFGDGADSFECEVKKREWEWHNFFDHTDLCGSRVMDDSINREIADTLYPVQKEWQKMLWHHEAHNSYWYHDKFTEVLLQRGFRASID